MLELVDTTMLTLEVNEKEQAPMGQRIRAVGMCFFKKGDLEKGNNYKLRRNSGNPKDTNCLEVRSRHITMAAMNKSDNNGVTGLHNSYPRVIATLEFGSNECIF